MQVLRRRARDHPVVVSRVERCVALVFGDRELLPLRRLRAGKMAEVEGIAPRVEVAGILCAQAWPEYEIVARLDRRRDGSGCIRRG